MDLGALRSRNRIFWGRGVRSPSPRLFCRNEFRRLTRPQTPMRSECCLRCKVLRSVSRGCLPALACADFTCCQTLPAARVQEPAERLSGYRSHRPSRERLPGRLFRVPGLHRPCQRVVSATMNREKLPFSILLCRFPSARVIIFVDGCRFLPCLAEHAVGTTGLSFLLPRPQSTIRSYLIELLVHYRLLPDGCLWACLPCSAVFPPQMTERFTQRDEKVYGNSLCALKVVNTWEECSCWWRRKTRDVSHQRFSHPAMRS